MVRFTDAACEGADYWTWFPARGASRTVVERARRICSDCPAKEECRDYAVRNGIKHGVWGGTTLRDRIEIRKRAAA